MVEEEEFERPEALVLWRWAQCDACALGGLGLLALRMRRSGVAPGVEILSDSGQRYQIREDGVVNLWGGGRF